MHDSAFIPNCPLCRDEACAPFYHDRRDYFECGTCRLVFVPKSQLLDRDAEKRHYDLHENSPDDPGYRRFLSRLFNPLSERLQRPSSGLDFGSGPGPTLSVMFEEAGHQMAIYDPFYTPDQTVFDQSYDFITTSEVVEHLHQPGIELDRLWNRLRPGGLLGIMTKRVRDAAAFARWHYKDDPTHVCFYSIATFEWLAERWGASLTVAGDDVVLFVKAANPAPQNSN